MKKKLIAGMTSTALIASIGAPAFAANFNDVSGHWAAGYINKLVDAGVINGVDATHFAPDATLTRAQFAKFVTVGLGLDTSSTTSSFTDVSGWAVGYVEAAKKAGIINGKGEGTFAPNDSITREEAAAIMVRALRTVGELESATNIPFSDASQVSSWFTADIAVAVKNGLLNGKDGLLAPKGTATRAEAAALTDRLMGKADELKNAPAKVLGVSAPNGKQLVVQFNKAVDADSVITTPGTTDTLEAGVVAVTRTSTDVHAADVLPALTGYVAALSADGKTLTITAPATKFFKGNYDVAVKGVKTLNGTTLENFYGKFVGTDTTAPAVTAVVYKPASDKFELTLSEPIDSLANAVVRVNGTPVSFDALSPAVTNKLTVARGSVAFGTSATLYVAGLKDAAGNLLAAYNGTVNVAKDDSALSVTSIQQVSNQVARVTLNKKLDTASDAKLIGTVASNGLVVTKPDGTVTTNYTVTAAAATVNPDGNVYDVTFTDATYVSSNTQNFTVTFTKDAYTDVTGNTNALYTAGVTLNKDVTAPTVTSTKVSTDGSKIEVTVSEAITAASLATGVTGSKVKLRKDGAELTGVGAALKAGTNNVIELTTSDSTAFASSVLKPGSYVARFETGAFKDVNTVDVAETNAPAATVTATAANPLSAVIAQGGINSFTVTAPATQTFTTSSLTSSHFTVDGVAVPAAADITLDNTRTVITVKLPANDSAKITGPAVFATNGLTLESGAALANGTATLTVTDNTAPTLVSAQLIGTNVLKLTFDENLGAFAPTTADTLVDDLQISNGVTNYNGLVTDSVIGSVNGKELVITVTPAGGSNWATIVGSTSVTAKTLAGSGDIQDTNNVAARTATVNVSK